MINTTKISIIVPIYNTAQYIPEALDSVLQQTLPDLECICINDCSTDDSLAILNEYAQKDSRIKIYSLPKNSGPGIARNYGIDLATGEYIMFLDPDDFLELDACEVVYNQISKNGNDIVIFDNYKYDETTGYKTVYKGKITPFKELINDNSIELKKVDKPYFTVGWTVTQIYKRSFLIENNIRYPDLYLCEDNSFLVQAFVYSSSVSILDKPIYNYRVNRKGSLTLDAKKWRQVFIGKLLGLKYIDNSSYRENFRKMYLNYLIKSVIHFAKLYARQDFNIGVKYYNRMQQVFKALNKRYDMEKYITPDTFKKMTKICKYNICSIYLNCFNVRIKAILKIKI